MREKIKIVFTYNKKLKRYTVSPTQYGIVCAYNVLPKNHKDYFWEHKTGMPKKENIDIVVSSLLCAGYSVEIIGGIDETDESNLVREDKCMYATKAIKTNKRNNLTKGFRKRFDEWKQVRNGIRERKMFSIQKEKA